MTDNNDSPGHQPSNQGQSGLYANFPGIPNRAVLNALYIMDPEEYLQTLNANQPAPPPVIPGGMADNASMGVTNPNLIQNLNQVAAGEYANFPGIPTSAELAALNAADFLPNANANQPAPLIIPGGMADNASSGATDPNLIQNLNQVQADEYANFPDIPTSAELAALNPADFLPNANVNQLAPPIIPGNVDEGTDDVADSSPESEATH